MCKTTYNWLLTAKCADIAKSTQWRARARTARGCTRPDVLFLVWFKILPSSRFQEVTCSSSPRTRVIVLMRSCLICNLHMGILATVGSFWFIGS